MPPRRKTWDELIAEAEALDLATLIELNAQKIEERCRCMSCPRCAAAVVLTERALREPRL